MSVRAYGSIKRKKESLAKENVKPSFRGGKKEK